MYNSCMKIRRRYRGLGIGLVLLVVVVGVGLGLVMVLGGRSRVEHITTVEPEEELPPEPVAVGGKMKLLLTGTTFWGRRTNKLARVSELGVAYPFSRLETLGRDEYEAWIGGLECPVTNNGHNDYNEYTLMKFNCDPDYLPEAAKWFSAFLLGNNHANDWGAEGFEETKVRLDEVGVQYFGHFDYANGTDNCGVVVLPVRIEYDDGSEQMMSMPLGFCSAHGVFGIPTEEALQNIRRYAEVLPTIVMPHMGAEYAAAADGLRMNLYRKMIDYGADMVIADHPHWVQNTEAYNGRLIAYSMGNFLFDQTFNQEVSRSAAIEARAVFDGVVDFEAWHELGEFCLEVKLGCWDKIVSAALPKITIAWQFDYHGTVMPSDCITRRANDSEHAAIGQRLNWATTMAGL